MIDEQSWCMKNIWLVFDFENFPDTISSIFEHYKQIRWNKWTRVRIYRSRHEKHNVEYVRRVCITYKPRGDGP